MPHFGHGLIETLLGEHLTLEEAELLADQHPPVSREEEIVIRDETIMGLDGAIEIRSLED